MHFDKQFLISALPKVTLRYDRFPAFPDMTVDSRKILPGEIFVALQGSRVDGHDFVAQALKGGAAGLIVAEARQSVLDQIDVNLLKDKLVVVVPDPAAALIRLATVWRQQFTCPVVGITGSVGKSSTKELVRNVLLEHGMNALVSYGNQNSLIGAPINVLKLRSHHQVAVFEMGISGRGEMSALAEIIRPTIAMITAIGHSHMAGLGALGDIAEEKRRIFKLFQADHIGIINGDQPLLTQIGYTHPVLKFGLKTTNQIQARKVRISNSKIYFTLKIYQQKFLDVVMDGNHESVVYNALGAVAVGCLLQIPAEVIVRGIQRPINLPGRFQLQEIGIGKGGVLIDDCYNASPESVKAALLGFEKMAGDYRKLLILGDMRELGADGLFWHRHIGRLVRKISSLNYLILVGEQVKEVQKVLSPGLPVVQVQHWSEAFKIMEQYLAEQRLLVLVKGSTRGYTEGLAELVRQVSLISTINKELLRQEPNFIQSAN